MRGGRGDRSGFLRTREHRFKRIELPGDFRRQLARYRFRWGVVVQLRSVKKNGLLPRVDGYVYEQSAILSAELLRISRVTAVTLGAAFHDFSGLAPTVTPLRARQRLSLLVRHFPDPVPAPVHKHAVRPSDGRHSYTRRPLRQIQTIRRAVCDLQ